MRESTANFAAALLFTRRLAGEMKVPAEFALINVEVRSVAVLERCVYGKLCMDGARGAREKLTFSEAFGCGHVFGL